MPVYQYEAKAMNGIIVKGMMDVTNESAVITALMKDNYFPVKIKEYKKSDNLSISSIKKVTIKDIAIFCKQFSVVITAGINVMRGLEIVKEQTENPKLKATLEEVFNDVQKGKNLSGAMGKHTLFPSMLISMVEVGEVAGTLDKILERMADYYDKEYKLNQKIKQALTYPVVVSVCAVAVVIFLVTKVIPIFVGILTSNGENTLPLPTRIVLGVSYGITHMWWLILLIIALIVFCFKSAKKNSSFNNKLDGFKLNMPIFGKINRKIITSRFARTFGILMGSGVPLFESLLICSRVIGNSVVSEALDSTREEIKKGSGIGVTLGKKKVFPVMLTQMIKIGEESGSLDNVLAKTAEFYDSEVETATNQLATLIEPIIIVILGFIVAFIIISIMLPMFQMYNSIK
jgi:type IV pilus assembly protein PilC